ncbi:MAG TPA: hypothetical protein VMH78_06590 [Thermoplasmata archaeon]|nr:hypothetical protein [Thermoplasmata archaeon]
MGGFRGSDERLDEEIRALEGIVEVRVRRTAREMRILADELAELRRERSRRRAATRLPARTDAAELATSG